MKSIDHAVVMNDSFAAGVMQQALRGVRMTEERLPFTVRVVRSEEALHKAVAIRQAAYARHMPVLAERLRTPEANDHDSGSVVLLAESKMDGSPLGTMRIQTNRFNPLSIEQGVELPRGSQTRARPKPPGWVLIWAAPEGSSRPRCLRRSFSTVSRRTSNGW